MAKKTTPVLSRANIWSLEDYAKRRTTFRPEVLAHKKNRTVHLGANLILQFEDEMTVRFQIQEMLHAEGKTDAASVQEELDAYLPLIPDGGNLKATMVLEYEDEIEKKRALMHLISDEDNDREGDYNQGTIHFLRFELTKEMKAALKYGVGLAVGVDHPRYKAAINPLPQTIRNALVADLK
jgi:hypothetical protein